MWVLVATPVDVACGAELRLLEQASRREARGIVVVTPHDEEAMAEALRHRQPDTTAVLCRPLAGVAA